MSLTATTGFGGSTNTVEQLIRAGRLVLDNCHVPMAQSKLSRLVRTFVRRAPRATGFVFFQYLAAEVQLSEDQKRGALLNPDIARAIAYADPTGEAAVNNVLREMRRG